VTPYPALEVPTLSSGVAAKLRVLDVSGCVDLRSIDFVRNCVQLRCLWMPACVSVSDLSPLGACGETLEELWMAFSSVVSLAPLKACPGLRKLDLRGSMFDLDEQVEDLLLPTCMQLADPASVELEGVMHELLPSMPPGVRESAAYALANVSAEGGPEAQAAIVAAGAIPALVQMLGSESSAEQAARALGACTGQPGRR
jgi:hypothetical protein